MARSNPASFAFGMLFEIAAVVVIVSLLPRFDLRPQTAASEPQPVGLSQRVAELLAPRREEVVIPTGFATSEENWKSPVFTEPKIQPQLSSREVEERLDRASQGLVNSLGSAAANAANNVLYSPGRPVQPSFPITDVTPIPPAFDSRLPDARITDLRNPEARTTVTRPSFPTAESASVSSATTPGFTYLPPSDASDSWPAARPSAADGQIPAKPWFAGQPKASREPSTQTPRRWRNY